MTDPVKVEQIGRFWSKVAIGAPDECWPWQGAKASDGYGRAYSDGKGRPATQVSWEIANGEPFPVGKMACHACDNPICVNPAHIWPGTQSENILDCVSKGRHRPPVKSHCKHGHPLTSNNRIKANGRCHECQKRANREWKQRWTARRRANG